MNDVRFGRAIRALRSRLELTQREAGLRAGVAQSTWSMVERGSIDRFTVHTLRSIVGAVGGEWDPGIRWRGGELDRVIDERHAALVGATVRLLELEGWATRVETTFSVFGERGSIDALAYHPGARLLLVVEVKTVLASVEETLRRHDAKVRLAPSIASERFGWGGVGVARLLVLPDGATPRRRVERHAPVLQRAYPSRGWELRRWLRVPREPISGLLFLSPTAPGDGRRGAITRRHVRKPPDARSTPESQSAIATADR